METNNYTPSLPKHHPLAQAIALALALSGTAQAAMFNVTNNDDNGADSLREAIGLANADAIADQITFDPGLSPIILSTQIDITEALTITGPAAD